MVWSPFRVSHRSSLDWWHFTENSRIYCLEIIALMFSQGLVGCTPSPMSHPGKLCPLWKMRGGGGVGGLKKAKKKIQKVRGGVNLLVGQRILGNKKFHYCCLESSICIKGLEGCIRITHYFILSKYTTLRKFQDWECLQFFGGYFCCKKGAVPQFIP